MTFGGWVDPDQLPGIPAGVFDQIVTKLHGRLYGKRKDKLQRPMSVFSGRVMQNRSGFPGSSPATRADAQPALEKAILAIDLYLSYTLKAEDA